ncbi:UNKNOWN [Stylonychia lemnae]|uniref:Uncharacterized protein n=1 Tax=Stylonychia lemnae TaxID=5949 RepID=A0A078B9H7_STYLE|nr:UNKNOWN [Stylonychia lemnae]|eukprot:CDW90861.1 UNKNOWN [Stylonychia lemnae]
MRGKQQVQQYQKQFKSSVNGSSNPPHPQHKRQISVSQQQKHVQNDLTEDITYPDSELEELDGSAFVISEQSSPEFQVHHYRGQDASYSSPSKISSIVNANELASFTENGNIYNNQAIFRNSLANNNNSIISGGHQIANSRQSRYQSQDRGLSNERMAGGDRGQPMYYNTLSPIQEQSQNTTLNRESMIKQAINKDRKDSIGNANVDYFSFECREPNSQASQQQQSKFHQQHHEMLKKQIKQKLNSKNSVAHIRSTVEQLFIYYCDFSIERAQNSNFIKQGNFIRLLKDSQILSHNPQSLNNTHNYTNSHLHNSQVLNEKEVNLMLSRELGNSSAKTMDFQTFLNMLVKIAVILFEREDGVNNPKLSLQRLLDMHILPLLTFIEQQVKEQIQKKFNKDQQQNSVTDSGQYIPHVSLDMIQNIEIKEEDLYIMKSINPVIIEIYNHYISASPASTTSDNPIKRFFRFLKEFEICPYLLNQRTCFIIYYYTVLYHSQNESLNYSTDTPYDVSLSEMMNTIKIKLETGNSPTKGRLKTKKIQVNNEHPELTFDKFYLALYRMSIIFYDLNHPKPNSQEHDIPHSIGQNQSTFLNAKKLLMMLNRMELTNGFTQFINYQRQFKSINIQYTLTPHRNVLSQLILNQQHFTSQLELEYYRENYLPDLDVYSLCKLYIEQQNQTNQEIIPNYNNPAIYSNLQGGGVESGNIQNLSLRGNKVSMGAGIQAVQENFQNQMEILVEQQNDNLRRIFQYYCSFGDPMNIDKMKSNKFVKVFSDAGLIQETKCNIPKSNFKTPIQKKTRPQNSAHQQSKQPQQNSESKLEKSEIDLIFKSLASKVTVQSSTHLKTHSPLNQSSPQSSTLRSLKTPNRDIPRGGNYSGSKLSHTSSRNFTKTILVSLDQNSISFSQFKEGLFQVAKQQAQLQGINDCVCYINMLHDKIIPLVKSINQDKALFSNQISSMLTQLENDDVLILLSDLYTVIYPVFEVYTEETNKLYIDIDRYSKFCSDFSIFPDVVTKSEMHKIFSNLAIDVNPPQSSRMMNRSQTSGRSMNNNSSIVEQLQQNYKALDSHLFIQALGFCALHISINDNSRILDKEQEALEKIFMLIEKLAMSEGIKKTCKKPEQKYKSNALDKLDILQYFRKKYKWYFEMKSYQINFDRTMKIQKPAFQILTMMDHRSQSNATLSARKPDMNQTLSSNGKYSNKMSTLSQSKASAYKKANLRGELKTVKTDLFSMVLKDQHM